MVKFSEVLFKEVEHIWMDYLSHPFIKELGEGTLPKEKFRDYLIEDYLYLKEYVKVFGIGLVKSKTMDKIKFHYKAIQGILEDENAVHINYLKNFNIDIRKLDQTKSSIENSNYTNYMINIAKEGDLKAIAVAIMPCTWSYFYIAQYLKEKYNSKLSNNYYREWIESYNSQEYQQLVYDWKNYINNICCDLSENESKNLIDIFKEASLYEKGFWDMAYKSNKNYVD